MRWDETGIFWDDYVPPKEPKQKIVRTPPDPIWLEDNYLPDLEEARAHKFDLMSDAELIAAQQAGERLIWDTEFYENYALLGFKAAKSEKIIKHETVGNPLPQIERDKFLWILRNFTVVGFNDTAFDIPMAVATVAGFNTNRLMHCADELINGGAYGNGMRPQEFYKAHRLKPFHVDHIDLIDLTPLGPGLKTCAGRLHTPRMADLPFKPGKTLTEDQRTILRWYWSNDLENTKILYESHKTAIELREILTKEYGVDVRSKSDPQIAEAVIKSEIKRITGRKYLERAEIIPERKFRYHPPAYLKYATPTMQWVLAFVRNQWFIVDDYGSPKMPADLEKLDVPIGNSIYHMGIGGLHSKEKKTVHISDENWEITDNDVTSYYPSLIIQQGMYPPNIGPAFLQVFKRIYDRRIAAKKSGDKATAETLKIVLNGTFGKTGERGGYSVVYYPEMMIQVTLTGQLSLLLLIEQLELNGIQVISANTDGIVVKCPRDLLDLKAKIMQWWEQTTGLGLESKAYKAIYSRDVNNYIALYEKPDDKETDAFRYAKAIGAYRKTLDVYPLKWNPTCDICSEAVIAFLATGKSIEETVRECNDVRKFIEVRLVRGGGYKEGIYLGKAIRWYYAQGVTDEIVNAKNGYMVPRSTGARPCMVLPDGIPDDLDHAYYIERAHKILEDFEAKTPEKLRDGEDEEEKAA